MMIQTALIRMTKRPHVRRWLPLIGMGWIIACPLPAKAAEPSPAAADEYRQGRALFDQGRYAEAASRFEKALAFAPTTSLYSQWLGRACGLEAEHAGLFAKAGLAGRSREALEHAVSLDPANLGARSDLAAYYAAAPGFMGGGLAKAQAQVAEIRRRDPYMGQVRATDLVWDDGNAAEAETGYLAAVRLDPKRPEARGRLGELYLDGHRFPQAFAQWDAVLAVDPTQGRALYGLGKTAALSGQRQTEGEAAIKTFLQTAKPDADGPPAARAHFYLARLLEKRGDRPSARAEYEAALRLNPKLDDARQSLASLGK